MNYLIICWKYKKTVITYIYQGLAHCWGQTHPYTHLCDISKVSPTMLHPLHCKAYNWGHAVPNNTQQ